MKAITIKLNNCHGIKKLNTQEISFKKHENKTPVCLIYASNGTMKTSFAKTFSDISNNIEPYNQITYNNPDYTIKIREKDDKLNKLKNSDIKERVLVINSMESEYNFNHISRLLINNDLKIQYEEALKDIYNSKNILFNLIDKNTGIKQDEIETTFLDIFNKEYPTDDFLDLLNKLRDNISNEEFQYYDNIQFTTLFNDKTEEFFQMEETQEKLKQYELAYNNLIKSSPIFNEDFNPYNINEVSKNLKRNNFFKANHYIVINDNNSRKDKTQLQFFTPDEIISSTSEFEKKISKTNHTLLDNFKDINKTMDKNGSVRNLRILLSDNQYLIEKLNNIPLLKIDILKSVLFKYKQEYYDLLDTYNENQNIINEIIVKAKQEEQNWKNVLDIFNDRFTTFPFQLEVTNTDDLVLKENQVPSINFKYKENNERKEQKDLKEFLSSGEQRAIYLLNIIFKLEIIEKEYNNSSDKKTKLLIIDDIADSFDYQNKYAIIEYLYDLSQKDAFRLIILTHNYDFYRNVKSRIYTKSYIAVKDENSVINLEKDSIGNNIFNKWKKELNEFDNTNHNLDKYNYKLFIATIPFIRNVIELKINPKDPDDPNKKEYNTLTKLLHIKEDSDLSTKEIRFDNITNIYDNMNITIPLNNTMPIYEIIQKEAEKILNNNEISLNLENKIVLSIAIRLKTEEFILNKINICYDKNQTRKLIDKYGKDFKNTINEEKYKHNMHIFNKVNLMTPESIHINSFMYEPILDMSEEYLKKLYKEVKDLKT